jgi:hypothetical protein
MNTRETIATTPTIEPDRVDEMLSILPNVRQIKRLVGSLSVEEEELEEVWRIADTVQTQILNIVEDLENNEDDESNDKTEITALERHQSLKRQADTSNFDYLIREANRIYEIFSDEATFVYPKEYGDRHDVYDEFKESCTTIGLVLRWNEAREMTDGLAGFAADDMREMMSKVDFEHPETIERLYPLLLTLKTGGLLKSYSTSADYPL